jgi:hypothetical protein
MIQHQTNKGVRLDLLTYLTNLPLIENISLSIHDYFSGKGVRPASLQVDGFLNLEKWSGLQVDGFLNL